MPIGASKLNLLSQNKESYLAVAHQNSPYVTVYKQDGDTFTKLSNPATLPPDEAWSSSWTSDGVYLALGVGSSPWLVIYKRTGDTLTKLSNPATLPADIPYGLAFDNSGRFLAVSSNNTVRIYQRTDDTFSVFQTISFTGSGRAVSWDSTGTYLLLSHRGTTDKIMVYKFANNTFTKLTNPASYPATQVTWGSLSNDGVYLAMSSDGTPFINLWKRTNDTFAKLPNPAILPSALRSCSFDPSGELLVVLVIASPYIYLYRRVGDTFIRLSLNDLPTGDPIGVGSWTADGKYFSVAHTNSPYLTIYKRYNHTLVKLPNPSQLPTFTGRSTTAFPTSLNTSYNLRRYPATLVANGNAKITTSEYKIGSSSYQGDGTTDWLAISDYDCNGSLTFTFECYVKFTALPASNSYAMILSSATDNGRYICLFNNAGTYQWEVSFLPGTQYVARYSTNSLAVNTWYHLAVTRTGTTLAVYQDGTSRSFVQSFNTFTTSQTLFVDSMRLGAWNNGSYSVNGYIDMVRVSNIVRYTSNFTSPTQAFDNDENTVLLLHMEGSNNSTTFVDNIGLSPTLRTDSYSTYLKLAVAYDQYYGCEDISPLIRGTGVISTRTQGTSSALSTADFYWRDIEDYGRSLLNNVSGSAMTYSIDGNIPSSASGTFVIEGYFKPTNNESNRNWVLSSADSNGRWLFGFNTLTTSSFGGENNIGFNGSVWTHIAIVCDAGTKRIYLNGIYKGAWQSSNTGFSTLHVGQFNGSDPNDYRGYIQDLRVYVGTNKGYTGTNSSAANFTLPSSIIESY